MARFTSEFGKPPGQLGPAEIRALQVRLIERKVSWTLFNQAVCALRFFYRVTLPRDFAVEHIPFAKTKRKLPTVLSVDEVRRLLGSVASLKHRALLSLIYATGSRLSEALHLQVHDIDGERMLVHIRCGKGGRPRMVPMSHTLRELLRGYWRAEHPRGLLFPSEVTGVAMHPTGVQKVFKTARLQARIGKAASVHTLRHSYATHLLELGVDLRTIAADEKYLGVLMTGPWRMKPWCRSLPSISDRGYNPYRATPAATPTPGPLHGTRPRCPADVPAHAALVSIGRITALSNPRSILSATIECP